MLAFPKPSELLLDLLQETTLPAFDKIQAEHVVPGIKQLLTELNANLDDLEKKVQPTWEGLVVPLERLSDRIERNWGAVTHLKVVLLQAWPHTCKLTKLQGRTDQNVQHMTRMTHNFGFALAGVAIPTVQ